MGGTINRPVPGQQQPPAPAGADDGREDDLASRLESDSAFADIQAENEPSGQVERPQEVQSATQPDRLTELEKRFEEREADWKQERGQLLGMLNRQQQPPRVVVEAPRPEPAKPVPRTDAEIIESLNKDPLNTVRAIAREAAEESARQVREELTGKVEGVRTETAQQRAWQARTQQAYDNVKAEYKDIYDDPKIGPEFDLEAGKELNDIIGGDWKNFKPSDAKAAAAIVHNRWLKSGKLSISQTDRNGGTNGSLREIVRSQPTHSDRSTSSPGATRNGNGPATPSSISELGFSQSEQRAARKIMKDWGLDERTYVANYLAQSRENPGFGKG
jgi:hypothetical protein